MRKLMLVDDTPGVHEMLAAVIDEEVYSITYCSNGEDALDAYQELEGGFDIVMTDIEMHPMNGIELLEALRGMDPAAIVIMLTGYASAETAIAALKAGAFDYIEKPFRIRELVGVLEKAAEARERMKKGGGAMRLAPAKVDPRVEKKLKELQSREQAVKKLEVELRIKDQVIEQAKSEVESIRMEMEAKEKRFLEMEQSWKDKEKAIEEREKAIAENEALMMTMEATAGADSLEDVEHIKAQLEEREQNLQAQEEMLMERESFLEQSENALFEKGQALQETETELEQREIGLTEMEEQFGGKESISIPASSVGSSRGGGGGSGGSGGGGAVSPEAEAEFQARLVALIEREEALKEREKGVRKAEALIKAREAFLQQSQDILFDEGS